MYIQGALEILPRDLPAPVDVLCPAFEVDAGVEADGDVDEEEAVDQGVEI